MPNDRNEPAVEPTGEKKGAAVGFAESVGRFEDEERRSEASQRHAPRLGAWKPKLGEERRRRSPGRSRRRGRRVAGAVAFPEVFDRASETRRTHLHAATNED